MRSFFWNLLDLSNILRIANIGWTNYMSATHGRVLYATESLEMLSLYTPRLRKNEDGEGERERRWAHQEYRHICLPRWHN